MVKTMIEHDVVWHRSCKFKLMAQKDYKKARKRAKEAKEENEMACRGRNANLLVYWSVSIILYETVICVRPKMKVKIQKNVLALNNAF